MVNDITDSIATVCKGISGVQAAYSDAPDNLSVFPCFVVFSDTGSIERNMSVRHSRHNLKMQLYMSSGTDTASKSSLAKSFIDLVIDTFDQHKTLKNAAGVPTCVTSDILDYKFGVMSYGALEYVGISFTLSALEVKQVVYGN